MNDGKDAFEKQSEKMLNKRFRIVEGKSVRSVQVGLAIVTLHQVANVIFNLATPIVNFTTSPEKYCDLWHEELGKDIEGIRSMLVILERTYERVNAALQAEKLGH